MTTNQEQMQDLFYFTARPPKGPVRDWEMPWGNAVYTVRERLVRSSRQSRSLPRYTTTFITDDDPTDRQIAASNSWEKTMNAIGDHVREQAAHAGTDPLDGLSALERSRRPRRRELKFTGQSRSPERSVLAAEDDEYIFTMITGPAPDIDGPGEYYRVYARERRTRKAVQIAFTDSRTEAELAAATHRI